MASILGGRSSGTDTMAGPSAMPADGARQFARSRDQAGKVIDLVREGVERTTRLRNR